MTLDKAISKYDSKINLDFLLHSKENVIFERKSLLKPNGDIGYKPKRVAEDIIWMLNAEWWTIVLWIRDWGVEDLSVIDNTKWNDYLQVVQDLIDPPANVKVEEVLTENRRIIIYHMNIEVERIFSLKDNEKVFLRVWDETRPQSREQVKLLEYDRGTRNFEEEITKNFDIQDLDLKSIEQYKQTINFEWTHEELLVYRNLAEKKDWTYHYKNSAILLFSNNPDKYIPNSYIRYVRYDGTSMTTWQALNVVKDQRFEGNVISLIESIKSFLNNVFKDFYYLDIESWKFLNIPEYPEDAWLEWVVNALTHRSYNIQWNPIMIKHYDDRLEISNSWPLPNSVTIENIRSTRFSRNPRVARVLYEMSYVRELNEWVNRIYESMEKFFSSEPEYKEKDKIVYLTLKNNVRSDEDTISEQTIWIVEKAMVTMNETEKKIISYLLTKRWATISNICDWVKTGERAVRSYLNDFIDMKIVQRMSDKVRDKNAIFKIKK